MADTDTIASGDIKGLIARAEKVKTEIATKRDEVCNIIEDLNSIANDCDDAFHSLEEAVDALSRLL